MLGLMAAMPQHITSIFSDITCGAGCWEAKEDVCRCSCGGRNHGIHLRGGSAERTAKIDGKRYKLLQVGKHRDLSKAGGALLAEERVGSGEYTAKELYWTDSRDGETKPKGFVENWLKLSGNKYRLKYATLAQLQKWEELAHFKVENSVARYHSDAALLWERIDG